MRRPSTCFEARTTISTCAYYIRASRRRYTTRREEKKKSGGSCESNPHKSREKLETTQPINVWCVAIVCPVVRTALFFKEREAA